MLYQILSKKMDDEAVCISEFSFWIVFFDQYISSFFIKSCFIVKKISGVDFKTETINTIKDYVKSNIC